MSQMNPGVLFSDEEIEHLFDPSIPFDPEAFLREVYERGKPEELVLEGIFHGGYKITAGRLIFVQHNLTFFMGDGTSDHPTGSYTQLQQLSGITRTRRLRPEFYVERFGGPITERVAGKVEMGWTQNLHVSWPHLDGMLGYMELNAGWAPDETYYIGFGQTLWTRFIEKLDRYIR